MATVNGTFYIDIYKGKSYITSRYGFHTKKDALLWLAKNKPSKAYLMREHYRIDRDGEREDDDRTIGEINRVKRKSGYVMVYNDFDPILGDDYKWDISDKGSLINKR